MLPTMESASEVEVVLPMTLIAIRRKTCSTASSHIGWESQITPDC